jgi:alkylglycerol monooxygenase
MGFIIVLAAPVFFLLIGLEFWWGRRLARMGQAAAQTYRLDDTISSISLGMISQISAIFTRLLRIGIYTLVFEQVALFPDQAWWSTWYGVLLALVFYDFCYYWFHRASHEVAVFWAGHVVHHQSQHYNLSTALRQSTSGALTSWIFYIPMAVAGVPPLIFGIVALIDLLYQFWVHTEHVGRLGWFDRWFCSPSNHRVHHAVNDGYVDRNYGGIWVFWDRLFGTFQAEDPAKPCVYGTRAPLNSWDPAWANLQVWADLFQSSWQARRWSDKLMVWLRPPGWQSADMAVHSPKPAFKLHQHTPFQPQQTKSVLAIACVWFVALLGATMLVLWHMDNMPWGQAATSVLAVSAGLWGVNALLQNRITPLMCGYVQLAAVTIVSQVLGWTELYQMFKPMTMLTLMFIAWSANDLANPTKVWLVRALGLSWVGDVLLLYPSMFLPGLVSFLAAHVCYIVMLGKDAPWLHSRRAVAWCMSFAVLVFVVLDQNGLPAEMRWPVAAYVLVIATMAAQAWGRAKHLGHASSRLVAWGSVLFMLSDSVLALDKFVSPLPLAGLWVLATYYLAQGFIVQGRMNSRH